MGESFDKFNFIYDNHVGTLLEGIRRHYEANIFADLMVVCDRGEVLSVHRWMIDIFAPQLLVNSRDNSVNLQIDKNIMKLIFEFFYKGNFEACTSDFTQLKKAAKTLSLDYLLTALDAAQSLDVSSETKNENVENTAANNHNDALGNERDDVNSESNVDVNQAKVGSVIEDKPETPESAVKSISSFNNNNIRMVSLLKSPTSCSKATEDAEIAKVSSNKQSPLKVGTIQISKSASGVQIRSSSGSIQLRKKQNGAVEVVSECGGTVEITRKDGAVLIANKGGKAIRIKKMIGNNVSKISKKGSSDTETADETWTNIIEAGASVRCVHCDFVAVKKQDFDAHLATGHLDLIDVNRQIKCRCVSCDFVAAHEYYLYRHWKEKHRPFKQGPVNQKKGDRHPRATFVCSECDFVTTMKKLLIRHRDYKHGDGRPFPCDQCNYVGKTNYCLKIHKEKHKPKTLECDICGKKLAASELLLKKHKKRHSDRFFPCQICEYRFREKGNLKRHLLRQHGVSSKVSLANEEEKCPLCDVVVLNKTYLAQHLSGVHKVDEQLNVIEPSLNCPKCEFTCHLESQLKIHKATVHKENMKSVLTKFSCQICGNSYSSKAHVNRHIEQVHNPSGVNATCKYCGYSSKSKDYLLQHIKRMHNKTQ